MTQKRKVTLIVEGHPDPVDAYIHEQSKLVSEGNRQRDLDVTMTTKQLFEPEADE